MGFLAFIIQAILLFLYIFALPTALCTAPPPQGTTTANTSCLDHCGNISIPFPFGTGEGCYRHYSFWVTCNQTTNPPILLVQDSSIEITNISLDGQLTLLQFVAHECYYSNLSSSSNSPWIELQTYFTVNSTANIFTILGCDAYGLIYGYRVDVGQYQTGCSALCFSRDDLTEGSCSGLGCCQVSIPKNVWKLETNLTSYNNYRNVLSFSNCSYAFLIEKSAFNFSLDFLAKMGSTEKLPMVADWVISNGTCDEVQMEPSTYACKSLNSRCYDPPSGQGYRCQCEQGYEGNPYLTNGCQDVNECKNSDLNDCEKGHCLNFIGGYNCTCPKGYHGDGRKDGKGCTPDKSLVVKIVAVVALVVIVLLLASCWLYLEFKRRRLIRMKKSFFYQNGGRLLQEKLNRRERSADTAKIFTSSELQKATNNFHSSMIIGQGGYGTVYKGFLPDNRIVAIKKSKEVDPKQIEQFVNEVIVLSQINHRNVVKLLGCCLETQVPSLVYEFISNGTLYENIHDKAKASCLNWNTRLRIAAETAGVLSYLHYAASPPIIHRDVKTANILLDHDFTAKVSDFGASRLVPVDQTQLSTMVQGTIGYLDPEYLQTSQLTEKSDVYSFGVVLVELLTGRKVLSNNRPEEERILANYFLSVLRKGLLFEILDDNVVCQNNTEQLTEVARLAQGCLNVKGEDRPNMKQVAMELDRLRLGGRHLWRLVEHNAEAMEPFLVEGLYGNSITVGYDSLRDHVMLPMSGGR